MRIYQIRTYGRYAYIGIWVIVLGAFVPGIPQSIRFYLIVLAYVLFVGGNSYRTWRMRKAVDSLVISRESFALRNNYEFSLTKQSIIGRYDIAITHINGSRDEKYQNHIQSPDWEYCDFSYNYYRQLKSGEYLAGTIYYGVIFAVLPRILPNIFFDSKKARGRQFRFVFKKSQMHSLEGDFDNYFATYFPIGYTIDSMSFIGPEVMQAMIVASDYDIEIINNKLYLYGPMSTDETDVLDMVEKLNIVKQSLLNDIAVYRDDRLPMEYGRRAVAIQGMALRKSDLIKNLVYAFSIAYIIFRLVIAFID